MNIKKSKTTLVVNAAEIRGSQRRENLEDTEYKVVGTASDGSKILEEEFSTGGKYELWFPRDDFAGYVIVINGVGHEFARTVGEEEASKILGTPVAGSRRKVAPKSKTGGETVVVAIMDTENFQWVAVGKTPQQAKQGLQERWDKKDGRDRASWKAMEKEQKGSMEDYYGIRYYTLRMGEGKMDED